MIINNIESDIGVNNESKIERNIALVKERVASAANKVGRNPSEIKIIAVTKMVGPDEVLKAGNCGLSDMAENRVQLLQQKLSDRRIMLQNYSWHLIGHLQTNKVITVLPLVSLIHSIDSVKLAKEIDKQASKLGVEAHGLMQLNISKEESKFGFYEDEIDNFLYEVEKMNNLKIDGIMTMAPYTENVEEIRIIFKKAYKKFIDLSSHTVHNINMHHLSMGMSNDFEIAVEEGATLIRLGTSIFY